MATNVGRDYFEIEAELKKRVEGDIQFDQYSRLLYSTDASIYQIEPIGVVVPRHKADVQAVIDVANRLGVSVLCPRRRYFTGRASGRPFDRAWIFPSTCRTFWKLIRKNSGAGCSRAWCKMNLMLTCALWACSSAPILRPPTAPPSAA